MDVLKDREVARGKFVALNYLAFKCTSSTRKVISKSSDYRNNFLLLYSFGLFEVAVNCISDALDFHSPTEGSSTRQTRRNSHNKSRYMAFIDYKVI